MQEWTGGRVDAVRFLSNFLGVDVNTVTRDVYSAFSYAHENNHLDVVRFLVTFT